MWGRAGLPRGGRPSSVLGRCSWPRLSARGFAYEDTLAFRLHGPKPKAIVIHPFLSIGGHHKPWAKVLLDTEEAISLARANRWDILPGPNGEPQGGWDEDALAEAEERDEQRRLASGVFNVPEGWHLDRGEDESDDEFDVQEEKWRCDIVRKQWAETCAVKVRHIDPNTYFGKGKVAELILYVANNPCDFVFVDTTLTPSQTRNLETVFNNALLAADARQRREEGRVVFGKLRPSMEVLDRSRLVMEIFALRARTSLAKLQVKIARLQYMKTRLSLGNRGKLRDWLRILHEEVGPFKEVAKRDTGVEVQYHYESEPFETERRLIRRWEKRYKSLLAVEKNAKQVHRQGRAGVPMIGIVGYTNVGKTALMNALTGAELKERDLPFETLDTTMRRLRLPSGNHAILVDSIGFLQNIPTFLFAAFKTTVEELVNCDMLLHVRDISHPQRKLQKDIVLQTLRDAGVSEAKLEANVIEVWNKIDKLPTMDYVPPEAVPICARDGTGVQDLLQVLDAVICAQVGQRRIICFPEAQTPRALDFLRRHGAGGATETLSVEEETTVEGEAVMTLEAVLSETVWRRWRAEVGLEVRGLEELSEPVPKLPPPRRVFALTALPP